MKAFKWIPAVAILAVSSALFAAESNNVALSHYEPLQRLSIRAAGNSGDGTSQKFQKATPVELSFDALGKSFNLQLEPNSRLLARASRDALPDGIEVYRGQLAGHPGSWARIVVFDGVPSGLVWDGDELFAIEAPGDSVLSTSSPVIYRLADALIAPGAMSCGSATLASNGAIAYQTLLGELGRSVVQAPGAVTEITMGAVGDFEFTSDKGGDAAAAAAITTRLNNVDGIFSGQLGVQISVQAIDTFSSASDPFSDTGSASTLLNELAIYRSATPSQAGKGLTHLYTGRNLDTSTVGIAFTGALCSDFFGAGLSEGRGSATFDSLIAAHEIGHNFGAPHDGQPGSVCESETGAFLMAPTLNGSDQFSTCSITQMEIEIAAAACITALPSVDMSIELDNPPTTLLLGANTVLTYNLVNNGSMASTNVAANFTLPSNLSLGAVTPSSGTCTSGAGSVSCLMGDVAGFGSRTVGIAVVPATVGAGLLSAVVSADVDDRPTNNVSAVGITVDPAVDLVVNTPTAAAVIVNDMTTVNATLENRSVLDATGVTLSISLSGGLQANSASWSLGSCTVSAQQVDCAASSFAANSSSTLTVDVRGVSSGSKRVTVTLASVEADANPADNTVEGSVRVNEPAGKEKGGGSAGPLFLYLLLLLSALVRRRP